MLSHSHVIRNILGLDIINNLVILLYRFHIWIVIFIKLIKYFELINLKNKFI